MARKCHRLHDIIVQDILFDSDYSESEGEDEFKSDSSSSEEDMETDDDVPVDLGDVNVVAGRHSPVDLGLQQVSTEANNTWNWTHVPNTPNVFQFSGLAGVNRHLVRDLSNLGTVVSELSVVSEFLTQEMYENISVETNRYAAQKLSAPGKKLSQLEMKWFDTTADEIKAYIALCVIMSQMKKGKLSSYWTTRKVMVTPIFGETMSLNRFRLLNRFLHFTNTTQLDTNDKLCRIRPFLDHMFTVFETNYKMEQNICVDESMIKFKGRLSYIQYNPSKRARFGIKVYKLCESQTGYCARFKIYLGKEEVVDQSHSQLSSSENVVIALMDGYLHEGYNLFVDNWYTSPTLFKYLLDNQTNAVGTVRSNRKCMPKEISQAKLKVGETIEMSCNNLLAMKWHDKRDVCLLSTMHATANLTDSGKKNRKTNEPKLKPECVISYNKNMGGIDRSDQLLACFPVMRRYHKGYRKIFWYILDIALVNSMIIHKKLSGNKKLGIGDFRINFAEQLLSSATLPPYNSRGRPSAEPSPLRLQAKTWAHFPKHIDPTEKKLHPKRVCKVCS